MAMTMWGKSARIWLRCLAIGALLTTLAVSGCGKKQPPSTVTTKPAAPEVAAPAPAPARDRLHQSFTDATRGPDNPPGDRPPDMTMTGKPTFKIFEAVQKSWDTIRFVDAAGKPIHCTAVIETNFGNVEIELKPESAPNHVRNFIALAKAGYYDGLLFDRIKHEETTGTDGKPELELHMVEAGCPVGAGNVPSGSIGYWLKEEFNEKEKHEEGTVGACREIEADTAATRFYITLDKAPYLDGNYTVFGKVKKDSLDVVRRIAKEPVKLDDQEGDDGSRKPLKQIVIQKVSIKMETGAQN